VRVHVHGFGAVAPAGGDGQRDAHAFAAELVGAGRGLGDAADGAVGDDAFDGRAVVVAQLGADQRGDGLRHVHGLVFEGLADAARRPSMVGRMPILGISPDKVIGWWIGFHDVWLQF
jgi:hypothetical protein